MALENITDIGTLTTAVANLPGMSMLVKISQAVGIVVIMYILILIIKAFMQMKQTLRIRQIAKNVEEINNKLDKIVGKKRKK